MQELKRNKKKITESQMMSSSINEEMLEADMCEDLNRGCNNKKNPCLNECEKTPCYSNPCEPCELETGTDCIKNPCLDSECCSPINLGRFNTANAIPYAIETNRVFDTMQFQIFQDASASDGSQLYFIYDVESVNGKMPTGGYVSVKIDEVCFDYSEIEINPGDVTLEGYTVYAVDQPDTMCESTFESYVCGEKNTLCCAKGMGAPSKFRERGLQIEVSDLTLILRGHCGCTEVIINAIPAYMGSDGSLVQSTTVGFRFNTLSAPICLPANGMGITLRQSYQTKLSVSCVSNANVQKTCTSGEASYTVNIPGGIDLILCVQEIVSILKGEQIVVLGSATPITPRVVDTFSRVCDFTTCNEVPQNNKNNCGCGCNK